jgi:hypothetical protein
MAITYKEIKEALVDLGFEIDDEVESEYHRVRLNAINRSLNVLWSTVILPNISYFEDTDDMDEDDGITLFEDTADRAVEDTDETNLPSILLPLLQLQSAHWLWLDDDLTKATIYWNEYDDLKNQILATIRTPRKAKIIGGF